MKEKKKFLDTELWKCIRTVMEILLVAAAIWGIVAVFNWFIDAIAEEYDAHRSEFEITYLELDGE